MPRSWLHRSTCSQSFRPMPLPRIPSLTTKPPISVNGDACKRYSTEASIQPTTSPSKLATNATCVSTRSTRPEIHPRTSERGRSYPSSPINSQTLSASPSCILRKTNWPPPLRSTAFIGIMILSSRVPHSQSTTILVLLPTSVFRKLRVAKSAPARAPSATHPCYGSPKKRTTASWPSNI